MAEKGNVEERDVMGEILNALSNYASPASLTNKIVGNVISSKQVHTVVRKILIDPIQSALIPHIKKSGSDQCREVFNAFLRLFPEEQLADILTTSTTMVNRLTKMLDEESPYYPIWSWYYSIEASDIDVSKLVRYKNALLFINYRAGEKKNFVWNIDFISSTKDVYNEFVKAIEDAHEYIEDGFSKRFRRRIQLVQMGGRRGVQTSYTMVPNTIVITKDVDEKLEQVISSVTASDTIKQEYAVNKTVGVLLYGPGGTGKSTIARYLAMRLGRTLILTGSSDLKEVIDYAKERSGGTRSKKYIILIEDIDFKFVDRRKLIKKKKQSDSEEETKPKTSETEDDDDDDEFEGAFSFGDGMFSRTDTLFQLLDGVLSDGDLMVVATTNYIDRLDPALIRDGRFDHKIEVLGLTKDDAIGVCKKFEVTPEEIGLADMKEPINPGTLQSVILKYKTSGKQTK